MILRFYAKGDALCPVPGQGAVHGAPLNYVGRRPQQLPSGQMAYPATEEPFEIDSESDAGRRLKLICWRDGDVYPADKSTAEHCQVRFASLAFNNGVWAEKVGK